VVVAIEERSPQRCEDNELKEQEQEAEAGFGARKRRDSDPTPGWLSAKLAFPVLVVAAATCFDGAPRIAAVRQNGGSGWLTVRLLSLLARCSSIPRGCAEDRVRDSKIPITDDLFQEEDKPTKSHEIRNSGLDGFGIGGENEWLQTARIAITPHTRRVEAQSKVSPCANGPGGFVACRWDAVSSRRGTWGTPGSIQLLVIRKAIATWGRLRC
jgi:hypothetical protein